LKKLKKFHEKFYKKKHKSSRKKSVFFKFSTFEIFEQKITQNQAKEVITRFHNKTLMGNKVQVEQVLDIPDLDLIKKEFKEKREADLKRKVKDKRVILARVLKHAKILKLFKIFKN